MCVTVGTCSHAEHRVFSLLYRLQGGQLAELICRAVFQRTIYHDTRPVHLYRPLVHQFSSLASLFDQRRFPRMVCSRLKCGQLAQAARSLLLQSRHKGTVVVGSITRLRETCRLILTWKGKHNAIYIYMIGFESRSQSGGCGRE